MRFPLLPCFVSPRFAAALAAATLLAACAARQPALNLPTQHYKTLDGAVLADLGKNADPQATLGARLSDPRRQVVPVPEHGCAIIIQPIGATVLKDGTALTTDGAADDVAWELILQSVWGDYRILATGHGWAKPLSSATRGWPDFLTGHSGRGGGGGTGGGGPEIALLQFDGGGYARTCSANIADSSVLSWGEETLSVREDLARRIIADATGKSPRKVESIRGMAFVRWEDNHTRPIVLVNLQEVVADGWSYQPARLGDQPANLFLYTYADKHWSCLGSALVKDAIVAPVKDARNDAWMLPEQEGMAAGNAPADVVAH